MVPADDRAAAIEAVCAERQASLDLEHGPLLRAVLFETGAGDVQRLFLAIHHLAVDGVSWRILLEDLETATRQAARGEAIALPAKTTSYREWAARLADPNTMDGLRGEAAHWAAQEAAVARLPRDFDGANTVASARALGMTLEAGETRALLHEVPAAYRTQINDLLLAALTRALTSWTGGRAAVIDLEGHGREDLCEGADLSRTVGWFTSIFPVRLELPGDEGPGALLKTVKEQLRRIPGRGAGYGVLRAAAGQAPRPSDLVFNYLGQFDGSTSEETLFAPASERRGAENAGTGNRSHLVEVNGAVREGRLRLVWTYSGNVHADDTIRAVVERYREALRELIAHCTAEGAGGYTPSDFPLARVSQAQLDAVLAAGVVEDVYPLSPLQQGILFHSVYARGERPYVIQLGWTIHDLDPAALRAAWEGVVRRHTVLRTRFAWQELDEPHQVVMREVELPWVEEDWRALPVADHAARLDEYLRSERERGFELDRAPLLSFGLFRTGEREWEFVWTHHHLVSDGWSNPLLLREVFALYAAQTRGERLELPRPRPYAEYAAWLARQDLARAEAYWRRALAGFTAPTVLGMDRGAAASGAGEAHAETALTLSTGLTERLRALGRTRQITLNTLVQGAWALLLSRYAGNSDVAFGAVVSGRPATLPGVEAMLGMFINTLPVRVRVDAARPVSAWLGELQAEQAEARDFDFTPLMQAQGWSALPRGVALFNTLLVFENYPLDALRGEAGTRPVLDVRRVRSVERTTYPLTLMALPRRELGLRVMYDAGRYDAAAAERMLGHLHAILAAVAADPDRPVASLDAVTEGERAQLAVWNDTAVAYPPLACVHHAIEAQADATPDAVAVVFEGEPLTYTELDERATRLARRLRALGVGPEVRVGLCLERSPEMVVAILAVLKAGGAYVPVDPSYPADRIGYVLADSGVPVLLTQARLEERLPAHGAHVVRLDAEWAAIARESAERFESGAGADTLAYVIYTSGSTGRPKGAMNAHAGIVNRLQWMQARYRLTPGDVVLQKTPFSFDVSVWEFLWPLMVGARMVVARPEGHREPVYLAELIEREGVTTLHFVPSMLQLFLDQAELTRCGSLRRVICSGEALPAALASRFHPRMPRAVELHNLYGPTEAAVDVTEWECLPDSRDASVPIGRPVANTQIHLLDGRMDTVPVGVPGELFIAGVQVGRGYLGRPVLTAEKFVPDPFSAVPGARMYRTGDVARRREDGAVEYVGRTDFQVKLRGLRIELGEIENALQAHPAVREAVVVAREDIPGEQRLAAYLVPAAGAALPDAQALRATLAARLPDYMVPAHFVAMDALPLSPSGKVERRALPAPERLVRSADAALAAPETADEAVLAELWAQVLGVERVGVDERFFELGGDSLKAMRLLQKAQAALGCEVPLASVLSGGTVRAMAAALDRGARPGQPLVALQTGDGAPIFCVHPDGPGHVGCYVALARALGPEVPVYGLQDPGCVTSHYRELTLEERAAWYLEGVRRVQPSGPYHLFGWSFGGLAAYEMARQLRAAGEEVKLLAMADTLAPALFRGFFLRPSPGRTFSNALFGYAETPLDVPVTLLRAADLGIWRAERQAALAASTAFGWDALAEVEQHTLPGNHNDMVAEPHVHALAGVLRPRLATAASTRRLFPGRHFSVNTACAQVLRAEAPDLARDLETRP
jgi:amino acid adenylation domain-containing protein/non-ribosomal peptide synthase protein (TIGR01720 family)